MKLVDLDPHFLKIIDEKSWRTDAASTDCDGIEFLCPKCYAANKGPVGTHVVICWKPHVPQTIPPTPGRWNHTGTKFEDLSLVAGSSSILLQSGCGAHFFVTNGETKMT